MAAYRAPSLLQPHKTRQAIADAHTGEIPPLIGIFTAWASPQIHKVVAQLGFDFVWVEWEHASMSVETMTQVNKGNLHCHLAFQVLRVHEDCARYPSGKRRQKCSTGTLGVIFCLH